MGGKVPESHYHREEFNKLDASGLSEPLSQAMAERLKNKKLPQKMIDASDDDPVSLGLDDTVINNGAGEQAAADPVALPFTFSSSKFPSFGDEFPFESNKVFNFDKDNQYEARPLPPSQPEYSKETEYFNDIGHDTKAPGYGDIPKKKPHLFTHDPYATGIDDPVNEPKFKPPPDGYLPPVGPYNTEFDSYNEGPTYLNDGYEGGGDYGSPYHPGDEDAYHDPEFGPEYHPPNPYEEFHSPIPPHEEYYEPVPVHEDYGHPVPIVHDEYGPVPIHDEYGPVPVHDDYGPPSDGYGPPSSDYGAPSADYGPPKPVGPILLDKRPYEVKEIKAVPIVTHETYTKFDCRNVPYPDRHYADPEAGCAVR